MKLKIFLINLKEHTLRIKDKMNNYIIELKNDFYNDIFGLFFYKLKELYDLKYKKYIEIKNEYHQIYNRK